jgi:DNA-binding MarR family transcriptional regulator
VKTPRPAAPAALSPTATAIRQTRPFRTPSAEAVVALLLAAEALRNRLTDVFAAHEELTPQQYNVLRILRGAGEAGLPTLEIVERMIERTPGVTRLLDRLEDKGLVRRERPADDRRRVVARATPRALALLKRLDPVVDAVDAQACAGLSAAECAAFVDSLVRVRERLADPAG